MYKNILIPTDGSELAGKAVSHGLALAKLLNAKVSIVTVTELWSAFEMARRVETIDRQAIEHYEESAARRAEKVLKSASESAEKLGIDCKLIHIKDEHPAEGIIEAASSNNHDLIVMASHGHRGLKKILLGSIASEVVSHSKIPVLIYR